MKNLNKKIGASLAALAFFTAAGFISKNALAVKPNPLYILTDKKDPDVMKVAETIKNTKYRSSYTTSDKKYIGFVHGGGTIEGPIDYTYRTTEFLEVQIYKLDKDGAVKNNHVVIRDYNLNNLDSQDVIKYMEKTRYDLPDWACTTSIKFDGLSEKTQQEIRKEYNKIIKEAPEKLLKADEEYKKSLKKQEEQKNKKLENDILNIIK